MLFRLASHFWLVIWKWRIGGVNKVGRLFSWAITVASLFVAVCSCTPVDTQGQKGPSADESASVENQALETQPLPLSSPTPTSESPPPSNENGDSMTLEEIEELVKGDLAGMLDIPIEEIQTLDMNARTWSDAGLECSTRKGFYEPEPVSGYEIILSFKNRQYHYHTDEEGEFTFCADPVKQIDPIR
jgi:hypothetical protein